MSIEVKSNEENLFTLNSKVASLYLSKEADKEEDWETIIESEDPEFGAGSFVMSFSTF